MTDCFLHHHNRIIKFLE